MSAPRSLDEMIAAIKGETWAIVYAYESPRRPRDLWYDRWRYDVLNDYVEAASLLGAEPYVLDVEQYLSSDLLRRGEFDFVVNLNSGATPISNLGVVPSMAEWHRTPCFPNSADVILTGERKDICKKVFASWFQIPADFTLGTRGPSFIRKPKTMGNSQGVDRCDAPVAAAADEIVEEFIEGYDVTIPVYFDVEIADYVVAPAIAYFPDVASPKEWFLSHEQKMDRNIVIERRTLSVDERLRDALLSASRSFQFQTIARYDFRWRGSEAAQKVDLPDLWFLEINCLPTLRTDVNFLKSIKSMLGARRIICREDTSDDIQALAFVMAHARGRYQDHKKK